MRREARRKARDDDEMRLMIVESRCHTGHKRVQSEDGGAGEQVEGYSVRNLPAW